MVYIGPDADSASDGLEPVWGREKEKRVLDKGENGGREDGKRGKRGGGENGDAVNNVVHHYNFSINLFVLRRMIIR